MTICGCLRFKYQEMIPFTISFDFTNDGTLLYDIIRTLNQGVIKNEQHKME